MKIVPALLAMSIAWSAAGQDQRSTFGSGSIEDLVGSLSARLESPVRNLTGLAGGWYDFDVPFARDITVTTAAAGLVTAVEEELGLKLNRSKGPVRVLIVEHIEKPTEN